MAKKKELGSELKELKDDITAGKVLIGSDRVLKTLKTGKLKSVYLASNCPEKLKSNIEQYAKLSETPVVELEYNNEELGVFCKKNFLVSVIGTLGE